MTEAEKIICNLYLDDLDKNHTCNEYKMLKRLIRDAPTDDEELTEKIWREEEDETD